METDYHFENASPSHTHYYIWPTILELLERRSQVSSPIKWRVLDLGCGNGALAATLAKNGYEVVGVDLSRRGIALARETCKSCVFEVASAYDDLPSRFGTFDAVVSVEVIEHLMWPRSYVDIVYRSLKPGGFAIISTPFHGYWKNLALALAGKMDSHFSVLWDGGHIKFFSEDTLSRILSERGFVDINLRRVGRIPPLAKSMIAVARRPSERCEG
jgi:2-polyprenyl-6-hydroxyphenyl methylase/3-demethylubiquinone-9 3-methyltransferase